MLTLEVVSGLAVIELQQRWFPANEGEIFSVVLRVTARALLTAGAFAQDAGMKAPARRKPGGDLFVAIQAFERSFPGAHFVAGGAIGGAVQRAVGAG